MLGRAAGLLVVVALALVPASASADVGPGGFGIADDLHIPSISLSQTFDELEPRTFRLNATWTALDDPGYLAQVEARISEANAAARTPGGMEIAVSFTAPPQEWEGAPLTGQAWIDHVAPFIDRFSSDVEWWGTMNEPNHRGWTFTPTGARALADFSVRLKAYLEQSHPADGLMSPDFMDHYNADGTLKRHPAGDSFVQRYVMHFHNAGGQFGSAIAWHPYGAVRRKSLLSTQDLVTTLGATSGAGLPIWVTEAGAHVDDNYVPGQTEAEQEAQVRWMADTSAGLASHDRVTRMHYYNVRQEPDTSSPTCQPLAGFPWDSGLVRACGDRRPAWYAWCLAARRGDAACYDDSPGVASWNAYRLDVYWRGNGDDAAIYGRHWDGAEEPGAPWSTVGTLGGETSSSPAAVAPAESRLDVYARGPDNGVWYRRYNGSSWSGWASLGRTTYVSPAAALRRGTAIVDVFVRGTNNAIYQRSRNGNTWSAAWASIGAPPGGATSAPAAVSSATGRMDVFVRGADSAIWRRTWTTSWGPWTSVGGIATSAPAVTSRVTNRIDLFFRGANGQVYQRFTSGSGWSSPTSLGGATISAPVAVAANGNRIDLWMRGTNNALQHKFWQPRVGWSGWSGTWFPGPRP
jgi:Glycosyl hydrolase catalytic core